MGSNPTASAILPDFCVINPRLNCDALVDYHADYLSCIWQQAAPSPVAGWKMISHLLAPRQVAKHSPPSPPKGVTSCDTFSASTRPCCRARQKPRNHSEVSRSVGPTPPNVHRVQAATNPPVASPLDHPQPFPHAAAFLGQHTAQFDDGPAVAPVNHVGLRHALAGLGARAG